MKKHFTHHFMKFHSFYRESASNHSITAILLTLLFTAIFNQNHSITTIIYSSDQYIQDQQELQNIKKRALEAMTTFGYAIEILFQTTKLLFKQW